MLGQKGRAQPPRGAETLSHNSGKIVPCPKGRSPSGRTTATWPLEQGPGKLMGLNHGLVNQPWGIVTFRDSERSLQLSRWAISKRAWVWGTCNIAVLVMVVVILKQHCKIQWVRNQMCLLRTRLEVRLENAVLFQPHCLRNHVQLVVGIRAKMAPGYRSS